MARLMCVKSGVFVANKDALRQFALAQLIGAVVLCCAKDRKFAMEPLSVHLCKPPLTQPSSLTLCYYLLFYTLIIFVFAIKESWNQTYNKFSCSFGPATSFTELKCRVRNFAGGWCGPSVSQEKGGKSFWAIQQQPQGNIVPSTFISREEFEVWMTQRRNYCGERTSQALLVEGPSKVQRIFIVSVILLTLCFSFYECELSPFPCPFPLGSLVFV